MSSTTMRRTRVLMAPAFERSRSPRAFSSLRRMIPASAASASRIGRNASVGAEGHRARTHAKPDASVEEPLMLRRVVGCRMREGHADRRDVGSRAVTRQLERHRQREFRPRRVQRRRRGVVHQEQQAFSLAVCPRRHAIAQQAPVPREAIEPLPERRARSQGVLDEVERAARQRLGEMDAERFVAGEARGEPPRHLGRRLGHANARILEFRPAEEPANGRGVDVAALDPCDEVRQHPALHG